MLFRRRPPRRPPSFEERLERLRASGFETRPEADGPVRVSRGRCAALIGNPPHIRQAGRVLGDEMGLLVDAGYQKFWRTPNGQCAPALADELRELHAFEQDLREALGLESWYNTSLGTVNDLHEYDRVKELSQLVIGSLNH